MTDTRIVVIKSDEELGQFLDTSIEALLGGKDFDGKVHEIDPNAWEMEIERLI